jgi:hypothetical protein
MAAPFLALTDLDQRPNPSHTMLVDPLTEPTDAEMVA